MRLRRASAILVYDVLRWISGAIVGVLLVACGDDGDAGDPDASAGTDARAIIDAGTTAADAAPLDLAWQPCPFYTGGNDTDAECANLDVPADWSAPSGATLELFVKRLGDASVPGQQIWFLMGGPGGASAGYESLGATLLNADPTLDIYLLDHRGTGRSSRLGCAAQEASNSDEGYTITLDEWPACIASMQAQWGGTLAQFTTTNAATDLGMLIRATRAPGQHVHVHGGSYGTFWAQRYLQVFPDDATSVSMLGVVHPQFSFTTYNQTYEQQGAAYLEACANDAFCAGKLGSDPEATMRRVMDDIAGECPEAIAAGLDRATLRSYFGANMLAGWHERVVALAIIYRIDRCNAEDIAALEYFAANFSDPLDGLRNDPLFSAALGAHVGLSDLWEPPFPTLEQAEAEIAGALFAIGGTTRLQLADTWPAYPEDEYADVFADTEVPILLINGEFDPASTTEQAMPVGEHFDGPDQHFVMIPGGSHAWTSPTTEGYGCAINIFYNFMQSPTDPPLDCVPIIEPLDFSGAQTASLLGALDLWEGGPSANVTADPALVARIRDNLARAARMR